MSGQEILSDKIKRLALQFLIKQYANHSFSPLMVNNELQLLDKDENTLKNSLQNYNCSPEHLLTCQLCHGMILLYVKFSFRSSVSKIKNTYTYSQ
ncbi:hypothetical protein CEXT_18041 [Caerostris extrusa]|uniref:Uncharacterized protein n=1 Tax=Caerostris extrusa TaxID=172846 RepID=A0AAV4QDM3_CAEEX|nr:hypothetical protein CEXT_18041 [Caerostris extrusa]